MSGTTAKKTKKQRKFGRNKLTCQRYRVSQRREMNKLRRLLQHMRVHGTDKHTVACEKKLTAALTLDRIKAVKHQLRATL